MQNPVSHFEIYANDPDALARFYTSVFDRDGLVRDPFGSRGQPVRAVADRQGRRV